MTPMMLINGPVLDDSATSTVLVEAGAGAAIVIVVVIVAPL